MVLPLGPRVLDGSRWIGQRSCHLPRGSGGDLQVYGKRAVLPRATGGTALAPCGLEALEGILGSGADPRGYEVKKF